MHVPIDVRLERVTFEAFVRDPVGRFAARDEALVWCVTPALHGYAVWGAASEAAVRHVLRVRGRVLQRSTTRAHRSVVDLRGVEHADPASFETFVWMVREYGAAMAEKIRQTAVLRPRDGVVAAVAAGFVDVLRPPHAFRVFDDPAAAFAWMGVEGGATLADAIDVARASVETGSAFLGALRAVLRDPGGPIEAATIARALCTSRRTLFRNLAMLGTSLRTEIARARDTTRR